MAKYWLCKSALDDVRNAVMDQMSLIALAELLDAEGDEERANKYISFTWECNRKFSPRMRSWQIAPLLSAIEQNYQDKIDHKSRILTIWTIAISVMLVIFIVGLFFVNRQRKQLRSTKLLTTVTTYLSLCYIIFNLQKNHITFCDINYYL